MAAVLVCLLFFLAMAKHSSAATYCLCKDGLSDSVLQSSIDYACGNGADCTAIVQGGSCYNPNTVKDHCNYAVNSYFQKKGQAPGTCDFSGSAATNPNPPTPTAGCVYPSTGSGATPTTPGTGTPGAGTGTPGAPGTPGTGTPGTPGTGTGTVPALVPGTPFPGLGPTGVINNPGGSGRLGHETSLFYSLTLALLLSGLFSIRI